MALSEAEFVSTFQAIGKLFLHSLINFGRATATNNVRDLTEAISDSARGSTAGAIATAAQNWRSDFSSLNGGSRWRALLDPLFAGFLKDLTDGNQGNLDPGSNWPTIYQTFLDGSAAFNARKLVSRGISYDSSPTEAGTGAGTIYRLLVDADGQPLEGCSIPLDVLIKCIAVDPDFHGEEQFSISAPGAFDALDQGTGVTFDPPSVIQGWNSDRSGIIADGSFEGLTVSSDPTSLGGNWEETSGNYGSTYFAVLSTGTPAGASVQEQSQGVEKYLRVKSGQTVRISQKMRGLDPYGAYMISMRVRAGAGLTAGTMTIYWGSKSQAVTLSSLTTLGTWKLVAIDRDADCYAQNFATSSDVTLDIAFDGNQDQDVDIDLIRVRPFDFALGRFFTLESDPTTPFQTGANAKTFLFEDALSGSDSVLQALIHAAYGQYLPTSGGGTVISDPT